MEGPREGRAAAVRGLRVRRRHRQVPPRAEGARRSRSPSRSTTAGGPRRPPVGQRRLQRADLHAAARRVGCSSKNILLETGEFRGTQGITPTPDGKSIYVSDYSGLHRIDLGTEAHHAPRGPEERRLNGIDGLVLARRQPLRNTERGSCPTASCGWTSPLTASTVTGAKILEMNNPAFDEPTLAVAVDGFLYVNAAMARAASSRTRRSRSRPTRCRDAVVLECIPIGASAR